MKPVELQQAFLWTCDNCGQDNFERAIACEISKEDAEELATRYETEEQMWLDGGWVTRPETVQCGHCGEVYETTEWNAPQKDW